MAAPRVSVIVPNYNHERFLPKRIESILNQTFEDFELIILDDCSTDQSRQVIKRYAEKDSRIILAFNEKNSGSTFAQWNKGVSMARAEYLWIAESDDYCEPQLLEKLVPILDQQKHVGIAMVQSYIVDEKDDIINSYMENYKYIYKDRSVRWEEDFTGNGRAECGKYLIYNNTIPNASGVLMRKAVYEKVGGPEMGWQLNGDWLFYVKMLLECDLAFVADHMNYFRMHQQTQRQKANEDHSVYDELIHTIEFIESHVKVDPVDSEKAWKEIASWWGASLFRQKMSKVYFRENRRLYRYFRHKRPRLLFNILSNFVFMTIGKILEVLGIKKVVKKWRSRWFPGKYFEY